LEKRSNLLILTGQPGVGKTTVVTRVVYQLRKSGLSVGGIYSRERRAGRVRTGFEMTNLLTGETGVLADLKGEGPRLGRYRVNLVSLAQFASRGILEAVERADVVVVDEVGPMELLSPEFRRAVSGLLNAGKPSILVVHRSIRDPLVEEIRANPGALIFEVTLQNRDKIVEEIEAMIKKVLPLER
jgi:nucleoside-triphosphatase